MSTITDSASGLLSAEIGSEPTFSFLAPFAQVLSLVEKRPTEGGSVLPPPLPNSSLA
jgi:hypothetical protein